MSQQPDCDEHSLVEASRRGDSCAFDALVSPYRAQLVEYAQAALGNRDDAEDAVQNALIYAWTHLDHYTGQGPGLKYWLRACVKNSSFRIREAVDTPDNIWFRQRLERSLPIVLASSSEPDPQDVVGNNEASHMHFAQAHLDRLPRAQKDVFECVLDGYTIKETSIKLGISIHNVRRNLERARSTLRQNVAKIATKVHN